MFFQTIKAFIELAEISERKQNNKHKEFHRGQVTSVLKG